MQNRWISFRARRRRHRCGVVLLLLCGLLWLPQASTEGISPEYRLKAALVYKLTRFVDWPQLPRDHFGICVLGGGELGHLLNAVEGREVENRRIEVLHLNRSGDIGSQCQVVFIDDSKRAFLKPIIQGLGHRSLLTVGDSPGFAEKGGMIQFIAKGKRIGLKINQRQVESAGLRIAAPLLGLATIVDNGQKDRVR